MARVRTSTPEAPAALRARAQASRVAPVVRTSSTSSTRRPSTSGRRRRRHLEGAGDIAGPGGPAGISAGPSCGGGSEDPAGRAGPPGARRPGPAAPPGCSGGRRAGSNGAAPASPDRPRPGARTPARASQRPKAGARSVRSACLKDEQHGAAAGIVAEHRPRPVEDRRGRPAGRAELIGRQLDLEGIAAAPAEGRGQELDGRPAAGAERPCLRSGRAQALAAADASRRQDQIEEPSGRPAKAGGDHGRV